MHGPIHGRRKIRSLFCWLHMYNFILTGDIEDEDEVLSWLTDEDTLEIPGRIEEVNTRMLEKILSENENVVVFFCKYLNILFIQLSFCHLQGPFNSRLKSITNLISFFVTSLIDSWTFTISRITSSKSLQINFSLLSKRYSFNKIIRLNKYQVEKIIPFSIFEYLYIIHSITCSYNVQTSDKYCMLIQHHFRPVLKSSSIA